MLATYIASIAGNISVLTAHAVQLLPLQEYKVLYQYTSMKNILGQDVFLQENVI